MSAIVPIQPPNVVITSFGPTGVQIGKPVAGSKWVGAGWLANYLNGKGCSLIAANTPGRKQHTASTSTTYRYYIWPRYNCRARMWVVSLQSTDEDAASGDFDVDGTKLGDWNIPADPQSSNRPPDTFYFFETVTQSDTATDVYCTLDVDAGSQPVIIHEIACYDVPRHMLAMDADDVGCDQQTCTPGDFIMSDADADVPTLFESIGGVRYGMYNAANLTRRDSHYHWYDPDGRQTSGTSYIDLFLLYPEVLGRKIYDGDGAGETQGRSVEAAVFGQVDGAEAVAAAVLFTTASGNTASVTVTSTLTWYGPVTFAVDCEDLTTSMGLRDATWETVQVEIKGGENAMMVYGISIGEPAP